MSGDIFILLIGIVIGGGAVWLIATAQAQARHAALVERIAARESQIQSLQTSAQTAAAQIESLGEQLKQQSERRSAAEEKNQRIPRLESELAEQVRSAESLRDETTHLKTAQSELKTIIEQERKSAEEKLALVNEAKQALSDAFKALSADALKNNNQSFLELAKSTLEKFQQGAQSDLAARQLAIDELLKPMKLSLEKVDSKMAEIEKDRTAAYAGLSEQVKSLGSAQMQLQTETANLVRALRAPQVRGRWGEIQLKRVVEMAGMIEHCDFITQASVTTEDGRLRPDLVVKLPGGKNVVVDAKCPLQAYLDALAAPSDELRLGYLRQHARQVADHNSKLGAKGYWDQFRPAPEFVVLFLPGETFFSAALEQDPTLIEAGVAQKVILATPTTLIALLRAVSYGWRQEVITQNAQDISKQGAELYERIRVLAEHFGKVGSSLNTAVESYNKTLATLDSRVLVTARRLKEMGISKDRDIEPLAIIEKRARAIEPVELPALSGPVAD